MGVCGQLNTPETLQQKNSSWILTYRRLDKSPSCTGTVEKIPLPQLEIQPQVTATATPEF